MHFVGVDGCRAGWLALALDNEGSASHLVTPEFAAIARHYDDSLILVDVPIGLRDSGEGGRACDRLARRLLGSRAASVFSAPCRAAIYEEGYEAASETNFHFTGSRLSRQTWGIVPGVRQLEEYLREHSHRGPVVREFHPEVAFWGLAGEPMSRSKKEAAGRKERLEVLSKYYPLAGRVREEVLTAHPRSELASDDVLDALVGATIAYIGADQLETLPARPERDSRGLRMEMVFVATGPSS
jgi:predicted RNase H-like nuclease